MIFLTPGEKIKMLRKQLKLKQFELEDAGISRNFISMVEGNKRKLNRKTALSILDILRKKAVEKGVEIKIDEEYILAEAEEEAEKYCIEQLMDENKVKDIDEIIKISARYNLKPILAKAYKIKGNTLYDATKYIDAFPFYYEALEIFRELQDEHNCALAFNRLGVCKLMCMEYIESLTYFKKAYNYGILSKEKSIIKKLLFNIALNYKKLEEFDNALEYLDEYIRACDLENEFKEYVGAIILKCNCYFGKGETGRSINLYKSIIKRFTDSNNPLLAQIYNNLGAEYLAADELDMSLDCFNKSQAIREKYDISNLSNTLIDKSKVFIKQNKYNEAISIIEEGLVLARKYNNYEYILRGNLFLEEIYIYLNDNESLEKLYVDMLECVVNKDTRIEMIIKLSLLKVRKLELNEVEKYLLEGLKVVKVN